MYLSEYPAAIARAAQAANDIDERIGETRAHIARLEGNAEMVIAFENNLKNDAQRKARRFEVLQSNLEYSRALNTLLRLTAEKSNAIAELERLRNAFSVAKLEARLSIAQKLTGMESRELVGL